MSSSRAPEFTAWLDAFFDAYYRQRPVNATFIGMHAYDDRLPDLSEAGQAAIRADGVRLLTRLDDLPSEPLTVAQELDRQLARGFLEIQDWETTSAHFAWGNPSLGTGEAVFGVLSLLLRPFAPLTARLELVAARLAAIPRMLDDFRGSLHAAPLEWCLRARRECSGAMLLLDSGLGRLMHDERVTNPGLERAAHTASVAFARFDAFIVSELLPHATDTYACGPETFDLLVRRAHFLETAPPALEQFALERMAEEQSALASGGPGVKAAQSPHPRHSLSPSESLAAPHSVSPSEALGTSQSVGTPRTLREPQMSGSEAYLARFSELWGLARDAAERDHLLTVPEWPVRYVEQPGWVREAAAYFYFLPYRSPAPFDATPVEYFAPPNADDSTIKLNHVIHHGSLGHHVQNWHAARAESRIGQIAAVDCASRIAMLCGGTLAEGWACYATDLAEEAGLLTPAERFAQHTARLRMAARAVVDVRLHQGRLSLDQAAEFYCQRVGMSAEAARAEAVKNSLFPGAACMYLAGWDGIWRLRRELQSAYGNSPREFHDRFLSFGSVPVSLVGQAMREASRAIWAREPVKGV